MNQMEKWEGKVLSFSLRIKHIVNACFEHRANAHFHRTLE